MRRSFAVPAFLFSFCAVVGAQAADPPAARSYPLTDHGVLKLSVPANWTEQVRAEGGAPPTIELTSNESKAIVLITPLWSPRDDPKFNSTENIRAAIERAAQSVQPTAVEKELVLRTIETTTGEGHFFWATDRAPGAGEHKFMANGGVPAGKLLLSFTVLSYVEPPRGIEEALAIVRSAAHEP